MENLVVGGTAQNKARPGNVSAEQSNEDMSVVPFVSRRALCVPACPSRLRASHARAWRRYHMAIPAHTRLPHVGGTTGLTLLVYCGLVCFVRCLQCQGSSEFAS